MVFSQTTTKAGIVERAYYYVFGESSDHSADYPLVDIAAAVNFWYQKGVSKILQADSRWQWDDTNQTDLPIVNITLVANQQDYGITAATFLKISKVDIKDSAGNSISLQPFDLSKIKNTADANFQSTAGTPKFYRVQGSSMFLYPKPSYGYTNGLRIFYQRDVVEFVSTDTTKAPGFAEPFHRILSLGAAYEYCLTNGMNAKMTTLRQEIEILFADLTDFYSNRNQDEKPSFSVRKEDYGQMGLGDGAAGGIHRPNGFF